VIRLNWTVPPTATRFITTSERVSKTLIQQDILKLLPDRPVEVVADLHLRPYYGEEYDSVEELYESLAKAGTTTFHGYATLYARVRNKRYTLAVRRLTDGDTANSILTELHDDMALIPPRVRLEHGSI